MDSLPLELLRLIFESCDAESVASLRLATRALAQVGYEYLLPPKFTALGWRDDIPRLRSIASHDRLRGSIESVTLNFSEVNEYNARHASYFQHYLQDHEERNALLTPAWRRYAELERRRRSLVPFGDQAETVKDAFAQLPNLHEIHVTFNQCPFDIDIMKEVFEVPNCRKMERSQACKNLNVIVTAMQKTQITSFAVDRVPLELFRSSPDRKVWFNGADSFARLTRLELTLDSTTITLPNSKFKAVNGLGCILRLSPNLTQLSLVFHNYNLPKDKFLLWFGELLGGFTFHQLTNLKLEGLMCEEEELREFLLRHRSTLERLRLGGRGLAKGFELGMGGIHLCRGSWKSLFQRLATKLPMLQRLHMEGDFESETMDPTSHESYNFHPITDEKWVNVTQCKRVRSGRSTINSAAFENYLIRGGDYPGYSVSNADRLAGQLP